MKSYFARTVCGLLIGGQLITTTPAYARHWAGRGEMPIAQHIKRVKENISTEGIMVAGGGGAVKKKKLDLLEELKTDYNKAILPLIDAAEGTNYKGIEKDREYLNGKKGDGTRLKWLKEKANELKDEKLQNKISTFERNGNHLGLKLLYFHVYVKAATAEELVKASKAINSALKDAGERILKQEELAKTVPKKEGVPEPTFRETMLGRTPIGYEMSEEERKSITEDMQKRITKLWELIYAKNIERGIVGNETIDPNAPWKYYVDRNWAGTTTELVDSIHAIYLKGDEKVKGEIDKLCMQHFKMNWVDTGKGKGVYDNAKAYVDKITIITAKYDSARAALSGAGMTLLDNELRELGGKQEEPVLSGTDVIILENLISEINGVGLDGPLKRMFRLDEHKRWDYDYAREKGIDVNSPTARLEVMLSIAKDTGFQKWKSDFVTLLGKTQYSDPNYSAFAVMRAFSEMPLQTQYQLMAFMKGKGWKNEIPEPELFAEFVIGVSSLSEHSSAQFLKRYGERMYDKFKKEDLKAILPFIGSRTHAREMASQHDVLNRYIDSLDAKLDFVMEYNVYKLREPKRKRVKSETISNPGGDELLETLRGGGAIEIRNILTLFNTVKSIERAQIAGVPIDHKEFSDIRIKEKIIRTTHTRNFKEAYDAVFGYLVNLQVRAPPGEIRVPSIGLDLYALEDDLGYVPGEFNVFAGGFDLRGRYRKTEDVSVSGTTEGEGAGGTESRSTDKEISIIPELGLAYAGPGRKARVEARGEIRMDETESASKEVAGLPEGTTTRAKNYSTEGTFGRLEVREDIQNLPIGEKGKHGMVYRQTLNYLWTPDERITLDEVLEPGASEGELEKRIQEDKRKNERHAVEFWLDHNDRGATSVARLMFDQKTIEESTTRIETGRGKEMSEKPKEIERKLEVEVFHRRPTGTFVYAGTFELTPQQAQQVYSTYRQVIGGSGAEGLMEGKSFQLGYSNLLFFDRDIFAEGKQPHLPEGEAAERITKYAYEGAGAATQLGKVGIAGVHELASEKYAIAGEVRAKTEEGRAAMGEDKERHKGLAIGSYSASPRIIGAGMIYANPEFLEISRFAASYGAGERRRMEGQIGKEAQPEILRRPTASIDELSKLPKKGGALEGIYIDSSNWYLSGYGGFTLTEQEDSLNTLRAGFLNKVVTDNVMWGVGGIGTAEVERDETARLVPGIGKIKDEKGHAGVMGGYVSNRSKTAFLTAALFAQQHYGWGGDLAGRYIGESWGAKVVLIGKDTKPTAENVLGADEPLPAKTAVFAGSELTFSPDGSINEVKLAYVGGMEVRDKQIAENNSEKITELQQHLGNLAFGKQDAWRIDTMAGGGDIIGTGGVMKIVGFKLIDKQDYKFGGVVQGGAFKGGEGIGVEGTMVTAGIGLGIAKVFRDEEGKPVSALRTVIIPLNWTMDTKTNKMVFEIASLNSRLDVPGGFVDWWGGFLLGPTTSKMLSDEEKKLKGADKYGIKPSYDPWQLSLLGEAGGMIGIRQGLNEYSGGLAVRGGTSPATDFTVGDLILRFERTGTGRIEVVGTVGHLYEKSLPVFLEEGGRLNFSGVTRQDTLFEIMIKGTLYTW